MQNKLGHHSRQIAFLTAFLLCSVFAPTSLFPRPSCAHADSINSPNITINVDTNRSSGTGAGNVAAAVSTVTLAETTLSEYSSGSGKAFVLKVRPGFHFDASSPVSAQSATIGMNGTGINVAASVTPNGSADEALTFNVTSGTNVNVQDIIRFTGIKIKILNATGAAGPAKTTLSLSTSSAGGAFTEQGIVAATITKGAADRLIFSDQPGSNLAGADLLPQVKMVDFGGNIVTNDLRAITLSLQSNPGSATLMGTLVHETINGVASWVAADDLALTTAADGYVLQASHSGAPFLTTDTVNSASFNVKAADPGKLIFSTQPANTSAGGDILVTVSTADQFGNASPLDGVEVTLDSASNPGGWPLLTDSSLTKITANGVVSWALSDHLRINKAITGYTLSASGLGAPVTSNPFNIITASANSLRFVQHPTSVDLGDTIAPSVTVEVVDLFGNRVDTAPTISLTFDPVSCKKGSLSGNSLGAVAGLATFGALKANTACSNTTLLASASGLIGARSDEFSIRAIDAVPISVANSQLKRGKLFRFSSAGNFSTPTAPIDDPTKRGAVLTVTGSTGSARYALPKKGWKRLGSRGFRFSSTKCRTVRVTSTAISAVCKGKTGSLSVPESELDIVLSLGKGTARFCGNCGGTIVGDEQKAFIRSACIAPSECP